MLNFDQAFIKNELLNNFPQINPRIIGDSPCYAISCSWWFTFQWIVNETTPEMLAGDPGPINNIDILDTDEETKKCIITTLLCDTASNEGLDNLSLWNKMRLKPSLVYGQDFVIISSQVWNFLHKLFGGGPIIELYPENYNEYEPKGKNFLTKSNEEMLVETCVNLELKKLSVIKDNNELTRYTFYAALSAKAFIFFQAVCHQFGAQYHQCDFCYYDDDINARPIIIITGSETLKSLGIKENTVITVTLARPIISNPISNPTFAYDDELLRSTNDFGFVDIPDPDFQNRQNENTSTKTDSTDLPNQNSMDLDEIIPGTGDTGNMLPRSDFAGIHIPFDDGSQISILELQQKIKKTITEEKIQLNYKPLKEIRHNLVRLQAKWLQPLKNNSMEKQQ